MKPRPFVTSLMRGFVSFVMTIVELLLFLRLVFRLFDANSANNIVSWVYNASGTLIAPFNNIFSNIVIDGRYVLEINTMIAWLFYAIVYMLILQVIKAIERALWI